MNIRFKACDCSGDLFLETDEDGSEWVCLQCGYRKKVNKMVLNEAEPAKTKKPAKGRKPYSPGRRNRSMVSVEIARQYKDEVIADYNRMLVRKFLRKWNLSSNTWGMLQKEWEVPGKSRTHSRLHKDKTEESQQKSDKLRQVRIVQEHSPAYWQGYRQAVMDGAPRMKEDRWI